MNCDVVFDSIIDNFDSAIFIIDKEFNLTRCNNYFLKIINGEKKDLKNKKINDILPFYQELNKNNRLKLVFQTGKKNISEEKLNVNSQSIYSKISLIPIVDKNEIEYVMIIIENISKIVQLSNKVKRSDEFIENVLNTFIKQGKKSEETCPDPKFLKKTGVFVTLFKTGELRGCIGYIEPIASIWDAITENVIASASKDYRFNPVEEEELAEIKIGLSILTTAKKCHHDGRFKNSTSSSKS